jgi:hypothetical protein
MQAVTFASFVLTQACRPDEGPLATAARRWLGCLESGCVLYTRGPVPIVTHFQRAHEARPYLVAGAQALRVEYAFYRTQIARIQT